jgi:hypothetical protein
MAEIELGSLARICLSRRIRSPEKIKKEVMAYPAWKNQNSKPINWKFTNEKARVKPKSLYPTINNLQTTRVI